MKKLSNQEIAEVLSAIGEYLEMQGVAFKPRAYEKAAETIRELEEYVGDAYARGGLKGLEAIPGVGASIAEKVEELLRTGRSSYHEELKRKTPVDLAELSRVEGLGPKSVKILYQELQIRNVKELEAAARAGKIAKVPGFGKKKEENILKGIEFLKRAGGRFLLGSMMPEIRTIEERLRKLKETENVVVAGSVRRRKETIGDADILVVSKRAEPIMDYFVSMPEVSRVYAHGTTKSMVQLKSGLDVDLRVVPQESYGAALSYFTGSKDHNVALREIAIKKGYKLNEYGLFKGDKRIAGETEGELYRALGMDYIEPEMRENLGEIERALRQAQGKQSGLPNLIGYGDLQGDLQVQTDWTDGAASIEAMAKAAHAHGLQYIAVTDHTKRLAMTHGLDEKRIVRQWTEIDVVNRKMGGTCRVLKGTECDILKDGTLDLPDEILAKLDVVGASVHSHFNLPQKEQTARVARAMENPHVDILFHPTGRLIQKREAIALDIEAIIRTAKRTKTALEIDAYPDRLDLKDEYVRKAVASGVKLAIDSDAHSPLHFSVLEYGIAQARRGWAERRDIINAWPLEKMIGFLKRR